VLVAAATVTARFGPRVKDTFPLVLEFITLPIPDIRLVENLSVAPSKGVVGAVFTLKVVLERILVITVPVAKTPVPDDLNIRIPEYNFEVSGTVIIVPIELAGV
jgi:hypothetical protein